MSLSDSPVHHEGFEGLSYVSINELEEINRLIKPTDNFLEVGSSSGVTCAILARMKPDARFVSIDPYPKGWGDGVSYPTSETRLAHWKANATHNQNLWIGDLNTFHKVCGIKFEVILVDGHHVYGHVFNDLLMASQLLARQGWLLSHDYINADWPEAKTATDRFCQDNGWTLISVIDTMAILKKGV